MATTITLPDIALLCGVERPLVTMWRKRTSVHGRLIPFPSPVVKHAGVEHFDVEEIRRYLAETGRGNNPDAALDASALAIPEGIPLDSLVALLCLRHLAEDDLAGRDLALLAREVDADDRFIVTELDAAAAEGCAYVDELMEVSYGPEDAYGRLLASRVGRTQDDAELTSAGVRAISPLVNALLVHLGADRTDFVDGSGGRSTAVLQLARELERPVLIAGDAPPARAARRRAVLSGIDLPARTHPQMMRVDCLLGLTDEEALDRADLLATELGPADLGMVIAPARLLTDRLRPGAVRLDRDKQAVAGGLRAAVRLPRALLRGASRQSLAIWVLTGALVQDPPFQIADLGDLPARDLDPENLGTDLVAAVAETRRHHFSYLVPRRASEVGGGRAVVARGLRAVARSTAPKVPGGFQDLVRTVAAPVPAVVTVVQERAVPARVATVAQLRSQDDLIVRPGTRLDLAWSSEDGTVATFGVEAWQGTFFDPLELEARAPQAHRTEPGDVVVTTSPPAALVDAVGGHLVPYPARILRLGRAAPLGPHTLAAQINRQPPTRRDLDAWTLRVGGGPDLERRLADIAALQNDLKNRLNSLDELAHHLVDGDAGLTLEITPPTGRTP